MTLASSSVGRPNLNIFYFEIVKDKGYSMKSSFIGYVFIETFPCHCAHLTSSLVLQTANTTTKGLKFYFVLPSNYGKNQIQSRSKV